MSENNLQQQQNDKKHRKLVRSPENLSPCDLEPSSFNPSFLSSSTNIFASIQSNSRSSPTRSYNDQFPPQQVWLNSNLPSNVDHSITTSASTSLPFSSSTPSSLCRKPSITIKYSRDEESKSETSSHGHQSSLTHHQQISKSIDSNHPFTNTISTTKHVDQMSNNFISNFENVPKCLHNHVKHSPTKQQGHQQQFEQQSKSLISFNDDFGGSNATLVSDIFLQQQQQTFAHSPTSQSLNLNLIDQTNECKHVTSQIVFNKNNPFLNDTFDAITTHEDEGGGKIDTNFFNMDDSNESDLLFFAEEASKKTCDEMEEQLLKNKREKFSNASTMKICLVVSPPTNKMFQVSMRFIDAPAGSQKSAPVFVY